MAASRLDRGYVLGMMQELLDANVKAHVRGQLRDNCKESDHLPLLVSLCRPSCRPPAEPRVERWLLQHPLFLHFFRDFAVAETEQIRDPFAALEAVKSAAFAAARAAKASSERRVSDAGHIFLTTARYKSCCSCHGIPCMQSAPSLSTYILEGSVPVSLPTVLLPLPCDILLTQHCLHTNNHDRCIGVAMQAGANQNCQW